MSTRFFKSFLNLFMEPLSEKTSMSFKPGNVDAKCLL
jgi:hypothetical protein